jgi:hypothetical protein
LGTGKRPYSTALPVLPMRWPICSDYCYDWKELKSSKTFDYQNKAIINLIGWWVYDMARNLKNETDETTWEDEDFILHRRPRNN